MKENYGRSNVNVRFDCSRQLRENLMSLSFSLQPQRLQELVLLKFVVKMEYGGINFYLHQWSPPSSPQLQEGVRDRSKFTGYLGRVLGKICLKKSRPPFFTQKKVVTSLIFLKKILHPFIFFKENS